MLNPDGTRLLPNARLVVDHFHLVKLANDAVTRVRRRVIWEQKGRRGRKIDPAWTNRRRLLTARERLTRDSPRVELPGRRRPVRDGELAKPNRRSCDTGCCTPPPGSPEDNDASTSG